MSLHPEKAERIKALLTQQVDEGLDDEARGELESLLLDSPAAQAFYVDFIALHSELTRLHGESAAELNAADFSETAPANLAADGDSSGESALPRITPAPLHTAPTTRQYWRRRPIYFWTLVSALTLMFAAGFFLIWRGPFALVDDPIVDNEPPSLSPIVATVVGVFRPVWGEGGDRLTDGSVLRAGQQVVLRSGLAKIRFHDGAVVLLEAPARLRGDTEGAATLTFGKLVASVPQPAHGFLVDTPRARLVDLGTEFGLRVGEGGQTSASVLAGEVEFLLKTRNGLSEKGVKLVAGESARTSPDGSSIVRAPGPSFVRLLPRAVQLPASAGQAGLVSVDINSNSANDFKATVLEMAGDHKVADLRSVGLNRPDDQIGVWAGAGLTNWWNYGDASATSLVDADGNVTTVSYTVSNPGGRAAQNWSAARPRDDLLQDGMFGATEAITTTIGGLKADTTYDLIVYHTRQHLSETVTVNGASAVDYTGSLANSGYDDAFDGLTDSDFWYFQVTADSNGDLVVSTTGANHNVITGFQLRHVEQAEPRAHEPTRNP